MKTPDKIKDALLRCSNDVCFGDEEICPYGAEGSAHCTMALAKDALACTGSWKLTNTSGTRPNPNRLTLMSSSP